MKIYITADGKEFKDQYEAVNHANVLDFNRLGHFPETGDEYSEIIIKEV